VRVPARGQAQGHAALGQRARVAEHHGREAEVLVAGGDGVEERGVEQVEQPAGLVLEQAQRVPRLAHAPREHRGLDALAAHVAEQEGGAC